MNRATLRGVGKTAHEEMDRSGGDRIDVLISSPCSFHSTVFAKALGGLSVERVITVWGLLECLVRCRLLPALPDAYCMEATRLSECRAAQCGHFPIPVSPWR